MGVAKDADYMRRMNTFCERLELLITKCGSVRQLAMRCCMDTTTIVNWRNRKSMPTLDKAMQLCKGTGVSLDWLIGQTDVAVTTASPSLRAVCNFTGMSDVAMKLIVQERKAGRTAMVTFIDKFIRWLLRPTKSELRQSIVAYIMWKEGEKDGGVPEEEERAARAGEKRVRVYSKEDA